MPLLWTSTESANQLWSQFRTTLAHYHLICLSIPTTVSFRKFNADGSASLIVLVAVLNAAGFWCCKAEPPSNKHRIAACAITLVCTCVRMLVFYRWSCGAPMTPVLVSAYSNGCGILAEGIFNLFEQVYALMVFPSIIVALGNTIHFVIMYGAFKAAGIQPRIPFMLAWWLLQIVLPHAYIWYTNRAVSAARRAAGAGQRRVVAAAPAGAGRLGAGETKPGITLSNKLVEGAPQKGVCSGSSDDEGPSAAFCKPGKRISGDSSEIQPLATDTQQSQVPAAKVAPTKVAAAQQQVLNGKAHTPGVQDSPMEVHQAFTPTQTQPPHQQQQEAGALSHPQSLEADSDHMQLVSTDGGKEQLPAPVKPWALGPAAVKPGYALLEDHTQLSLMAAPAPSKDALKALRNAQRLALRASSASKYQSRLAQSQVILKLKDSEPSQLSTNMLSHINEALQASGSGGWLVGRACIRRGCTLVVLDLIASAKNPSAEWGMGMSTYMTGGGGGDGAQLMVDDSALQSCLTALLAPGQTLPDGSLAYITTSGGRKLQGRWSASSRAWSVAPDAAVAAQAAVEGTAGPEAVSAAVPAPLSMALLHVSHPLVTLPSSSTGAGTSSSAPAAPHLHRATLVLRLPAGSTRPEFVGLASSAESAPEEEQDPHAQGTAAKALVCCVARGSWGACLPVNVADVVVADGAQLGLSEGGAGTPGAGAVAGSAAEEYVALTLEVDIHSAPHAGCVHLELWQGRDLLLGAPLLLLPPPSAPASPLPVSKEVASELQRCLDAGAWEEQGVEPSSGSESTAAAGMATGAGNGALLADLGQLLHTAACITAPAVETPGTSASAAAAGAASTSTPDTREDPAAWGGIAAGLARQCRDNAAFLASIVVMAEGLVEFFNEEEGMPAAAALVSAATAIVQDRIQQLEAGGGKQQGGHTSTATSFAGTTTAAQAESPLPAGSVAGAPAGPVSASASTSSQSPRSDHMGASGAGLRKRHVVGIRTSSEESGGNLASTTSASSTSTFPSNTAASGSHHALLPSPTKQHSGGVSAASGGTKDVSPNASTGGFMSSAKDPSAYAMGPTKQHGGKLRSGGVPPREPTFRECARATLRGFKSREVERRYAAWATARSSRLVQMHSLMFATWMLVWMIRSATAGWAAFFQHLPIHLVAFLPYVATVVLEHYRLHRWQELTILLHAIGRTISTSGRALGFFEWPRAYGAACAIRLDTWGEVLAHSPYEPMRFPFLVATHGVLLFFNLGFAHICGDTGLRWVLLSVLPRAAAFMIGLASDMARRRAYMREELHVE